MKLLILATDYPKPDGYIELMYVHVRNKYYIEHGIEVTVLNFKAKDNYTFEGVDVITLKDYRENNEDEYDFLVCHAPNIRNHYIFLRSYGKKFKKIVFFFHGHEVLKINSVYPKPYNFKSKSSIFKSFAQNLYDTFKLRTWKKYFYSITYKSYFICVSELFYNEFLYWTGIEPHILKNRYSIINNSVGRIFEEINYNLNENMPNEAIYDYITVRNNFDSSVYCIDIVVELARKYPQKKFLIIGKGEYFKYNKKPNNITLKNQYVSHEDMLRDINLSRCALMPTRRDTQGVMSCELATFGIPLITSNIPICHEIFDGFQNVAYIDNENLEFDLEEITRYICKKNKVKQRKYFALNTCGKEVDLLHRLHS